MSTKFTYYTAQPHQAECLNRGRFDQSWVRLLVLTIQRVLPMIYGCTRKITALKWFYFSTQVLSRVGQGIEWVGSAAATCTLEHRCSGGRVVLLEYYHTVRSDGLPATTVGSDRVQFWIACECGTTLLIVLLHVCVADYDGLTRRIRKNGPHHLRMLKPTTMIAPLPWTSIWLFCAAILN